MTNPQVQSDPIYSLPFLYMNGLNLTTTTTTVSIAAGQCRDSNDIIDMPLGSAPLNGGTTAAPLVLSSAAKGANGLDTGSIAASTMYFVYLIGDSRYFQPIAGLISLSATLPLMPAGYDSMRLIGAVLTDSGSHFLPVYVAGNGAAKYFQYDTPIAVLTGGTSNTAAPIDLSVAVPSSNFGRVYLQLAFTPNAAGDTAKIRPTGGTGYVNTMTGQVAMTVLDEQVAILPLLATAKPEIDYILSTASASLTVSVQGFDMLL